MNIPGVRKMRRANTTLAKPWEAAITVRGEIFTSAFATQEEAIAQRLKWEKDKLGMSRRQQLEGVYFVIQLKKPWTAKIEIDGRTTTDNFNTQDEAIECLKRWQEEGIPAEDLTNSFNLSRHKQRAKALRQIERLGWNAKK